MRTFIIYNLCALMFMSLSWVFTVPIAHASQVDYIPLAPINAPGSEFVQGVPCKAPTCFPKYLRTIYNVGIAIAGLFVVFSIVHGGFTLIFTDSILGHSEAKGIILKAVGGAIIVYSSFILMNAISPALGDDLDLSLAFPTVAFKQDTSTLTVVNWTDEQIKMLRDRTAARDAELTKQIADLREKARLIRANSHVAGTPNEEAEMLADATEYERQANELDLKRVAEGKERLSSIATANASTRDKLEAAIAEANNNVTAIRTAFEKARNEFDLDPDPTRAILLRMEEMQRISTVQKSTALGILENPPLLDETKRNAFITLRDAERDPTKHYQDRAIDYVNQTTLVGQVETRINEIIAERDKQKANLDAVQTAFSAQPQGQFAPDLIIQKKEDIDRIAQNEICNIKDTCETKKYKCKDLYPTIQCHKDLPPPVVEHNAFGN